MAGETARTDANLNGSGSLGASSDRKNGSGTSWFATEALIVGLVTVLAAIASMAFEVGYSFLFFGVPIELIQIDAQRVLVVALMTLMGVLPIVVYLLFAYSIYTDGRPLAKVIGAALLFASPMFVLLPFTSITDTQWYVAVGLVGICVCCAVGRSLYLRLRHGRPIGDGLSQAASETLRIWTFPSKTSREPTIVDWIVGCGLLIFLPLVYVMLIGARLPIYVQQVVLKDQTNYVFVRRYGENFVFKQFDPATGEILDGIEVRTLQSDKSLTMQGTNVALKRRRYRSEPPKETEVDRPADALAPENVIR